MNYDSISTDALDKSILEDWVKEADQFISDQNYEEAADVLGAALRMLTVASDVEEFYYDLGTHVLVLEKYIYALEMSNQKQRAQSYYQELESKKEELKKQVEQIANEQPPMTLEEVGKVFNVTRERIRQIEGKALRKLRYPGRSKKLKDFLK